MPAMTITNLQTLKAFLTSIFNTTPDEVSSPYSSSHSNSTSSSNSHRPSILPKLNIKSNLSRALALFKPTPKPQYTHNHTSDPDEAEILAYYFMDHLHYDDPSLWPFDEVGDPSVFLEQVRAFRAQQAQAVLRQTVPRPARREERAPPPPYEMHAPIEFMYIVEDIRDPGSLSPPISSPSAISDSTASSDSAGSVFSDTSAMSDASSVTSVGTSPDLALEADNFDVAAKHQLGEELKDQLDLNAAEY